MPKTKTPYPPLILESSPHTLVFVALGVNGAMTPSELNLVTKLEQSRLTRILNRMQRRRLVIKYPWHGNAFLKGGLRTNHKRFLWALDPHHPQFLRFGRFAGCLVKDFPLPAQRSNKRIRSYNGPRFEKYDVPQDEIHPLGTGHRTRILMLLSRVKSVPIETLSGKLGHGRATWKSLRILERFGIVSLRWSGTQHLASLNPEFCGYWSIRKMCRAVDAATGHTYKGLALSLRANLNRKRLAWYSQKRKVEAAQRRSRAASRPSSSRTRSRRSRTTKN